MLMRRKRARQSEKEEYSTYLRVQKVKKKEARPPVVCSVDQLMSLSLYKLYFFKRVPDTSLLLLIIIISDRDLGGTDSTEERCGRSKE